MRGNTPLNTDDELRNRIESVLMEVFKPYILRDALYDERQPSGLDQFTVTRKSVTMAADVLTGQLIADRKKHELEARIDELAQWLAYAEELGEPTYHITKRLTELKQELEKL